MSARLYAILSAILLSFATAGLSAFGQSNDTITASLVTCYPGEEVYELCGHAALRIRTAHTDSVWNYGLFDFSAPNFIGRFVKGETDYRVAGYPAQWFFPDYMRHNRRMVEQDLNLTPEEVVRLRDLLRTESLPENCVYRYNYVKDNCATRIYSRIAEATGGISFPQTSQYGTFRNEMRRFHQGYPWYQFGIDLALGSGLDYQLKPDEEMFVPTVMMERFRGATLPDGRPLVKEERVIFEGSPDAVLPPTPWYAAPLFWAWITLILIGCLCAWQFRRRRCFPLLYSLWSLLCGLAGCLIAFLVFVSTHEASSPNYLIWWLNPLWLLPAVSVWIPSCRRLTFSVFLLFSVDLFLLLALWPIIPQSANPAFFPLMGSSLILSLTWVFLHISEIPALARLSGNDKK